MEYDKEPNTKDIGFCLLPSDLLQNILLHLCIPEVIRMKQVNRYVLNTILDRHFNRLFNLRSQRDSWLFVYAKRWRHDGALHGLSDRSSRWFKIPVTELLSEVNFPGEDLYLLTANGPRGTSSWRRSGMKLISGPPGSGQFRFLFAEIVDNRSDLYAYDSRTNMWESKKGVHNNVDQDWIFREKDQIFLNISNRPHENVLMSVEDGMNAQSHCPVILQPRFNRNPAVRFSQTDPVNQPVCIYGDGCKIIIEFEIIEARTRRTKSMEVWSISANGEKWEIVSRAPDEIIKKINKPCSVTMGCLERRLSAIRVVLIMSNLEGLWDIIRLSYDKERDEWEWVPLPDCRFLQGSNMGGFCLSSGLTLS
ncbi:PREDICTED: uncharacterized protein LOC104815107 [Tarenaya hassleriana]|uniref:uncharacterized protein LOC104815107 n=1 Tax=Tarenaya hassleriana TaxID=28532 RepID=UPI00053C35C0|nr:PREDICTED: uncharacterized protein LOC104815107 [Tarenaya hassleriana]